jgi:hypothetical protein
MRFWRAASIALTIGWFGAIADHHIATPANAAEPVRHTIAINKRKVDAGQKLLRVSRGDRVELEVSSDEAAELHLHGYDKLISVVPGKPGTLRIEANIAGRFSLEAHSFGSAGKPMHLVLFYLEVLPR